MAFVNQQPRGLLENSKALSFVDSGFYLDSELDQQKKKQHHYAPFLSMQKRNKNIIAKSPGPGSYNLEKTSDTGKKIVLELEEENLKKIILLKKPNSYFLSKVKRFTLESHSILGPGHYFNPNLPASEIRKKFTDLDRQLLQIKKQRLLSILQGKHRKIPAIPDADLKYGYTQTKQKNLIPIVKQREKIVEKDPTVQPEIVLRHSNIHNKSACEFQPLSSQILHKKMRELIKDLKEKQMNDLSEQKKQQENHKDPLMDRKKIFKYKKINTKNQNNNLVSTPEIKFHKEQFNTNNTGPSQFTAKKTKKSEKFQFFGSSSIRFKNTSPSTHINPSSTFHPITPQKKLKQNFAKQKRQVFDSFSIKNNPGPASYNLLQYNLSPKFRTTVIGKQPRFKPIKNDIPAPGEYYHQNYIKSEILRLINKKKQQPFSKSPPKDTNQLNPLSPFTYNLTNQQFAHKYKSKSKQKQVPFGSKQERFNDQILQDEQQYPYYSPIRDSFLQSQSQAQCSFKSKSPRFLQYQSNCKILQDTLSSQIGPGTYSTEFSSLKRESFNIKFR